MFISLYLYIGDQKIDWKMQEPSFFHDASLRPSNHIAMQKKESSETSHYVTESGAPNEDVVQNHLT